MRKIIYRLILILLSLTAQSAFCQKYKAVEDIDKLNQEYSILASEVAKLNTDLLEAQENFKKYQTDFEQKDKEAKKSADASSDQADKATDGEVKHAKKAKQLAGEAYEDRKDADEAKDLMEKEEKKIKKINKEVEKKKKRLTDLDKMREAINNLPKKTGSL